MVCCAGRCSRWAPRRTQASALMRLCWRWHVVSACRVPTCARPTCSNDVMLCGQSRGAGTMCCSSAGSWSVMRGRGSVGCLACSRTSAMARPDSDRLVLCCVFDWKIFTQRHASCAGTGAAGGGASGDEICSCAAKWPGGGGAACVGARAAGGASNGHDRHPHTPHQHTCK